MPVKQGLRGVVDVQVFKVTMRTHAPNKKTHSPATELLDLYSAAFLIINSVLSLKLNCKA